MKIPSLFLIIVVLVGILSSSLFLTPSVSADDGSSPITRGSWSDTVRDLIATTQEDHAYRHVIVQELLSSSSHDSSFADAICARPQLMRCVGNSNDNKGSATSTAWPVEITIRRFNGTVHYDKLPKATQTLIIDESIIPIDVVDLISKLPNGIESLRFERSHLTTMGGNIFPSSSGDKNGNNNNNAAASTGEPQIATLTSVTFERCTIDSTVLETGWLPVNALKSFNLVRNTFSATSITPLLVSATELEEVRIISNKAPIHFRELLAEISLRTAIQTIDFQAGMKSAGDQIISTEVIFPKNLIHLRLCNLSLRAIPKHLPPKLNTLELPFNSISTGGEELGNILVDTSLWLVDLSNNTIEEFPNRLPASIKRLRFASNKLKGKMDFTSLPRELLEINVAHNELSGNVDLTKLPGQMETFDIAYNKFSGPINMREFPDSVRYMFLHFNEFTGRYDVSRLPLLSVKVLFGGNKWDSLIPRS